MEDKLKRDRAAFFTQYWGQKVFHWKYPEHASHDEVIDSVGVQINKYAQCGWLDLKALSDITDEDAIEVGKKVYTYVIPDSTKLHESKDWIAYIFCNILMTSYRVDQLREFDNHQLTLEIIDFLRSRGYALPYMGYSVDQLVEMGWVKLKDK